MESIPPAYVALRAAGTITLFVIPAPPGYTGWRSRFLGFLNVYKFGAPVSSRQKCYSKLSGRQSLDSGQGPFGYAGALGLNYQFLKALII
jgi:hypothetical protein